MMYGSSSEGQNLDLLSDECSSQFARIVTSDLIQKSNLVVRNILFCVIVQEFAFYHALAAISGIVAMEMNSAWKIGQDS